MSDVRFLYNILFYKLRTSFAYTSLEIRFMNCENIMILNSKQVEHNYWFVRAYITLEFPIHLSLALNLIEVKLLHNIGVIYLSDFPVKYHSDNFLSIKMISTFTNIKYYFACKIEYILCVTSMLS